MQGRGTSRGKESRPESLRFPEPTQAGVFGGNEKKVQPQLTRSVPPLMAHFKCPPRETQAHYRSRRPLTEVFAEDTVAKSSTQKKKWQRRNTSGEAIEGHREGMEVTAAGG